MNAARRLLVDAVDLDSGTIALRGRTIFICDQIKPLLALWLRRLRRLGCEWLFPDDNLAEAWSNSNGAISGWIRDASAAASIEGMNFTALYVAHAAYANYVPRVPGIEVLTPPRPRGDDRSIATGKMMPILVLELDELTLFMALLRRDSATWKGHRLYAAAAADSVARPGNRRGSKPSPERRGPRSLGDRRRESARETVQPTLGILRRWLRGPTASKRCTFSPMTPSRDVGPHRGAPPVTTS